MLFAKRWESQKVWRRNTRGDYWLLDLVSRQFKQLGGVAAPVTMMFAKFSPDGKLECLTAGDFDAIKIEAIDSKNGWLYFEASPQNPTQRYLYRVAIGGGTSQRISPMNQSGTHTYLIAPNNEYAVHTYSTFCLPPVSELIRLSDHTMIRELAKNLTLKKT